jgi:hypothetical protein
VVAEAAPCRPDIDDNCETDPGGGGGGGGGGGNPVLTTPTVNILDRTDTTIDVRWFVSDVASSFRLEHFDGGGWSTLYSSAQGWDATFEHEQLGRDTRHCYRLVARRLTVTKTSANACAYTKDGLGLRPLWRVQLRITTADVAGADTDDEVRIGVHGPVNGHSGGGTWLDWARDDFERGAVENYDLVNLAGIKDLGDIEGLEIYKPGSDDWCLANVTLLVNDAAVFSTGFGDPCRWINQGGTELVQISHDQLHGYPLWGRFVEPHHNSGYRIPLETMISGNIGTLVIGRDHFEGRFESQVGDATHDTEASWGPPDAVEMTRVDAHRATVDLDLEGGGADIDVDFDLVVGTHKDGTGKWFVDIDVVDADATVSPAWYQWLFVAMSAGIEVSAPERQIESAFVGIAEHVGIAQVWDLTAEFDDAANLVITAIIDCPRPLPDRTACLIDDTPRLP